MTRRARIVILGAGTAGLSTLKDAQRYTDDVLLINDGPYGTTCARVGCMPSKALLEVAHAYARRNWLAGVGIAAAEGLKADLVAVMAHVRELRDGFTAGAIRLAESLGERNIHGRPRRSMKPRVRSTLPSGVSFWDSASRPVGRPIDVRSLRLAPQASI